LSLDPDALDADGPDLDADDQGESDADLDAPDGPDAGPSPTPE
jgi:hypothetical protein